jgi:putative membrane protein
MAGQPLVWVPYCGAAPLPGELLFRWNLDPVLLAALGAAALSLWRAGRTREQRRFGLVALVLALALFVSPFCALSSALFAARVTHHVLLTAALAPLIVHALPPERLSRPGSLAAWTGLHAAVFWLWHAPVLYGEALSHDALYWVMQLSLLGTAVGFWAALRRASGPAAIGALLFATVQMGLLGALLTFSGSPLYVPHFLTTQPWGLSPLEDQQLGGIIMWAPAAGLYLGIALLVAWHSLAREDRELIS